MGFCGQIEKVLFDNVGSWIRFVFPDASFNNVFVRPGLCVWHLGNCVRIYLILGAIFCIPTSGWSQSNSENRLSTVEKLAPVGWQNACQIWDWAEPGYQETKSAALLSNWLQESGFQVQRGVAGIPTAFTATIGTGHPVMAVLGEYDALPGLAQRAVPYQQGIDSQSYGHACGHHLFGVASAMAAIALGKEVQAGRLSGTVRYYGCPAEEGGSAKVFMVRDGLFSDVDFALHWHPSASNSAGDRSTLARIAVKFRFHGVSAHAAGAPDQARSALDAVELTNFGVQLLREHIPQDSRIHYVITSGGEAPNVVPDFAEVYYYVRHPNAKVVRELYQRVLKCAQAGALATETRLETVNEGGIMELVPNNALSSIVIEKLRSLNDLRYGPDESEFALKLQETLQNPNDLSIIQLVVDRSGEVSKGSTDVGDVSWVVPTAGFTTSCWVPGTPGHSWQAVACGRTEIARRGMILAAKVLTESGAAIMQSPAVIQSAKQELQRRLNEQKYDPLISPDQQPPLNYRRPAKGTASD
ncbi:MAG: amidohydrolase [Planctomycetaceae bacterium]|nr:amidohydrolase [Planctomycetaceae bacterium]